LWNAEFWGLFRLATPLALAQAGLALLGLVDMLVVSRVSDLALAAVGLGNALFFTFAVFGMATLSAVDPLVSQAMGAKEPTTARTHFWQGVSVSIALSLALCIPLLACVFSLERFGVEPELAQLARGYVLARLWSLPAMLLFSTCRAYFQGIGKPGRIFYVVAMANLFNLGAVMLFVQGWGPIPAMGAVGAGLATALCSWLNVGLILWGMGPPEAMGGAEGRGAEGRGGEEGANTLGPSLGPPPSVLRRPSWKAAKRILKLGLPIGLQAASESIVFTFIGVVAATIGQVASAAHQAALTWMGFSFCFALGLGNAASVRIGWAIGRKAWGTLRRTGAVAMASALSLMAPWALLFSVFSHWPASLTTHSAEALALALPLFVIGGFFQLMDGLNAVVAGLLRGTGDTKPAFYISMLGYYVIGAPLGLYLAFIRGMGVKGLWWGLAVGLMAMGPAMALRFYHRISKPLERV